MVVLEKETEAVEYKRTTGELKNALIAICAMLNKQGYGTVYFGVNPNGEVVGQDVTEDTLRDVSCAIYEAIKPTIYPAIKEEEIDGKHVIKVSFCANEKPYSANGIYYVRTADENRAVTPAELKNYFLQSDRKPKWDEEVSDAPETDVDDKAVRYFCSLAIKAGRLPEGEYTSEMILKRFGLVKDGHLTNAGNVLFGSKHPVVLKAAVFATNEKLTFLDIQLYDDNIYNLLAIAETYVMRNIRWRGDIIGFKRVETPEIPIEAVRETIANSFAHAVYRSNMQHEICIFPGKVTFFSPGSYASDKTPEEYIREECSSELRNPTIARMFFLSGTIEEFGSGFRRINSICEDSGVKYSYEMSAGGFKMIFYRKEIEYAAPNAGIVQNANKKDSTLSETEKAVYALLMKNPSYTAEQLISLTSKSLRTIRRTVQSLKEKGFIKRVGSDRQGYWEVH